MIILQTKEIGTAVIVGVIGFIIYTLLYNYWHRAARNKEKTENSFREKESQLKNLNKQGILTNEEYQLKLNKIKEDYKNTNIKNSPAYKKLESLKKEGILTETEFQQKIELLKNINQK